MLDSSLAYIDLFRGSHTWKVFHTTKRSTFYNLSSTKGLKYSIYNHYFLWYIHNMHTTTSDAHDHIRCLRPHICGERSNPFSHTSTNYINSPIIIQKPDNKRKDQGERSNHSRLLHRIPLPRLPQLATHHASNTVARLPQLATRRRSQLTQRERVVLKAYTELWNNRVHAKPAKFVRDAIQKRAATAAPAVVTNQACV